jgi:catechol 2,3-dioxygenase-like lactoylglutathione lyase family enzyme
MATLSRIAPEIPVLDLKKSVDYYREKLGFELAALAPSEDYAVVERDGIAIHLFEQAANPCGPAGVHIFTHQLEELRAELYGRGAAICQEITRKPWGNRDFRVQDCAGNVLKFTEPAWS